MKPLLQQPKPPTGNDWTDVGPNDWVDVGPDDWVDVPALPYDRMASALRQTAQSGTPYRPEGYTAKDFQSAPMRALSTLAEIADPRPLLEIPKQMYADVQSGMQGGLGDAMAGFGKATLRPIQALTQLPGALYDQAVQAGTEIGEGDWASGLTRGAAMVAPFARGARSGALKVENVADRTVRRTVDSVSDFASRPTVEAPEMTFMHALRNINPEIVPTVMNELKRHLVETGAQLTAPTMRDIGRAVRTKLIQTYESVIQPQRQLVIPGARKALYDRQLAAIPEDIRINDTATYSRRVRELQNEYVNKPELTVGEIDNARSDLSHTAKSRPLTAEITSDHKIDSALEGVRADAYRDLLYDFLDRNPMKHGSYLRDLNKSIGAMVEMDDTLFKMRSTIAKEAGKTKGMAFSEALGRLTSPSDTMLKYGRGSIRDINSGVRDALERWPDPGPRPSPWRPAVPTFPTLPPIQFPPPPKTP